jgi:hypothetical protein
MNLTSFNGRTKIVINRRWLLGRVDEVGTDGPIQNLRLQNLMRVADLYGALLCVELARTRPRCNLRLIRTDRAPRIRIRATMMCRSERGCSPHDEVLVAT